MEGAAATSDVNANIAGRVSLEDLSRDDLLKQVRRQRVLMQKMKNKCDELTKRCSDLESEKSELSTSDAQITELKTQIDVLNAEKEQATTAYANIQAAQEEQLQQFEEYERQLGAAALEKQQLEQALKEYDKKYKVLQKERQSSEEQLECMKLKLDTLTSTCQFLQEDLKKVQLAKKEMESNLRVMEEARDEALQSLKGWKENANESLREVEKLKGEVQILKIERNELLEKFNRNLDMKEGLVEKVQELQDEKEKLLKIISDNEEKMSTLQSELESKTIQINDELTNEQQIESTKNENNTLKIRVDEIQNENSALKMKIEQLSMENEQKTDMLMSKCDTLTTENEKLTEELKWAKEKYTNELNELRNEDRMARLSEAVLQIGKLETELNIALQQKQDAIEELIQVKDLQSFVEDEAKELREENEKLKIEIKTLEADLENDKMHIRKLEKEIHSTEERERNCNIECEKVKVKLYELEEINKELRDNVISEEIGELMEKYKSLQTEKDVLVVQVENLSQEMNVMNQQMLKQCCISFKEQGSQTELFCSLDKETSIDNKYFDGKAELIGIDSSVCLEVNETKKSMQRNESNIMGDSSCSDILETSGEQQYLESCTISDPPYSPEHYLNKDVNEQKIVKDGMDSNLICLNGMNIDATTQTINTEGIFDADKALRLSKSTSCDQIGLKDKAVQSEIEEYVDSESKLAISSVQEKLEETRNKMYMLNQEKCALFDSHHKLLNDNQILERDYKDALEKIAVLTQTLHDKSEVAEKIHCQMDSLLNQIDELNSQLEEKENDLVSAGKKLQNNTEEIDKLRKTYELKNEQCEICRKELEDLQSSGYHLSNECPLVANYNTLVARNNDLQEKYKILQTSYNELEERLSQENLLEQEKCALLDDHHKLLNDNQMLERDYKDALEKIAVLTQALQDKSEDAEKIRCQMDSLLNQIDELNSQSKEKENDLVSAGKKLQDKTEELDELRKTYELKNEQYEIYRKELEDLQSSEYHLTNECPLVENYNTVLARNNDLQEKYRMLQASYNKLQERLNVALNAAENQKSEEILALTHEVESYQLLRREQENEINHLHQINKDLNKDLLNALQEISALNELKSQCEQTELSYANFQKEKSELENEVSLLTSRLEHSENEIIFKLKEDINKSNNEISFLKDEIIKYHSSIEESRKEINNAVEEKQKAVERISILERHMKTVEECSTEKCLKVQEEANLLKEQLESLKHYVKTMSFFDEVELLKHYVLNIKSLGAESECLKLELQEKQALLDDYRCKLEESKQQLANVQSLSEDYAKQNLALQGELENIRAVHSNSANEIDSCQEKLREQKHLLDQLELEKSQLLEEIALLKVVDDRRVQSSDVEIVQKELKESEERMKKIKAVALKTRKELADVKKQLNNVTEERNRLKKRNDQLLQENEKTLSDCRQYLSNFQSLQSEYDKIEDKYEAERLQTKQLQQDIAQSATELVSAKEKLEELKFENESLKKGRDTIASEKKNLEHLKTELDGKLIILDSLLQNETKKHDETKTELQNISQKVKQLEDQLKSERLQHTSTTQQLEQALKEAKQQNLLNLEIDDYKRIVSETKAALEEKVKDIKELHSQLAHEKEKHCTLTEEMKHIESQWKTEESRANNLKELLSKTKEELSKLEHKETMLNEKLSEQQRQLESLIQQEELYKVQLSEASAENRKLYEMMQSIKDSNVKTTKSLETKIDILEEQLRMSGLEVENTKQEFENYKIRVHSVLKQKKEQSPVPSTQDESKQQMEKLIEQSRAKLEELSQKLQASLAENSAIQEEKDQLVHHLTKLTEEMQAKESAWTKRLNQMLIERDSFQKQQESLSEQLQQQSQVLTATFKQRLQTMQEKHNVEINSLQKQLEAADVEISHLQREYQKSSPAHPPDDLPHFDIFSQERQEGEGSECTDRESITPIVHPSLNTIPTSGFLPFEQLLQTPTESLSASVASTQDVDTLSSNLATTHKKLEHVTELLNESEANNLRMTEQVRVLKEEIRRLERNKERQDHAENLEYLKNIIVKFITLEGGDERLRLIPVLTTMLRLSPEEQAQMLNIASGEASSNASTGWGNYLHRWSGLV